uniref:Lactate dehydrogenase D n=1 Tax=Sinocyclocheilus grahami TaxID=75366 RepID=A0A672RCD1_SINGR
MTLFRQAQRCTSPRLPFICWRCRTYSAQAGAVERVISAFRSVSGDEGVSVGSAGRDESVHRWDFTAIPEGLLLLITFYGGWQTNFWCIYRHQLDWKIYGTMRENVLNLEVVLADGTVLHTAGKGRRPRKTSASYNLTNLFVGSEGTLGIITKATLRLYGIPESMVSAVCSFPSVSQAFSHRSAITNSPALNSHHWLNQLLCWSECSSKQSNVMKAPHIHSSNLFRENSLQMAFYEYQVREGLHIQNSTLYKNVLISLQAYSTDVCVPISRLPQIIVETKEDLIRNNITGSHVGDGNFHCLIVLDPNDPDEVQRVHFFTERLARRALAMDGTCTGEHGIGLGKQALLREEVGPLAIEVMLEHWRRYSALGFDH